MASGAFASGTPENPLDGGAVGTETVRDERHYSGFARLFGGPLKLSSRRGAAN